MRYAIADAVSRQGVDEVTPFRALTALISEPEAVDTPFLKVVTVLV